MGAQHWTGRNLHGVRGKVFGKRNAASGVEDLASRRSLQRRGNSAAIGVPRDAAPDKTMTKKAQARQKCLRQQIRMILRADPEHTDQCRQQMALIDPAPGLPLQPALVIVNHLDGQIHQLPRHLAAFGQEAPEPAQIEE